VCRVLVRLVSGPGPVQPVLARLVSVQPGPVMEPVPVLAREPEPASFL
jgi:hypothetical protein